MNSYIFLAFIAAIAGVAVALQGQFMGVMDKGIGTRESVFITYASGGIVAAVVMLASRGANLKAWQGVPWYALSSGILGLVIVTIAMLWLFAGSGFCPKARVLNLGNNRQVTPLPEKNDSTHSSEADADAEENNQLSASDNTSQEPEWKKHWKPQPFTINGSNPIAMKKM